MNTHGLDEMVTTVSFSPPLPLFTTSKENYNVGNGEDTGSL